MSASPAECIAFLKAFGFSYRKIAKLTGVPASTICLVAVGKRRFTWETGEKIQEATRRIVNERKAELENFLKGRVLK